MTKKAAAPADAFEDSEFSEETPKKLGGGIYTCPHCNHYFETRGIKEIIKCPKCKSII